MSASLRCFLFVALLAFIAPGWASDIEAWRDQGHLEIDSWLQLSDGAVPGQKLQLTLEVATDSWFTGGTRISIPEVAGLVILQTEQFASNSNATRHGESWVVQRWTLDVYPQKAGNFAIGPIPLAIQVSGGTGGTIQGTVLSPPVQFSVHVPAALEQAESWVAAPDFSARQSFDRSLEGLAPGDAFERRIEFRASDVMAMMLPTLEPVKMPGLAAYPSPPKLTNSNNRGEALAIREQSISYVVESPGDYLLPAQDYFWWDTGSGELRVLTLPATEIHVAGDLADTTSVRSELQQPRQWALLAAGLLLCAALTWLLLRFRPWRFAAVLIEPLRVLWQRLIALRKPALPQRLNPDGSAGD